MACWDPELFRLTKDGQLLGSKLCSWAGGSKRILLYTSSNRTGGKTLQSASHTLRTPLFLEYIRGIIYNPKENASGDPNSWACIRWTTGCITWRNPSVLFPPTKTWGSTLHWPRHIKIWWRMQAWAWGHGKGSRRPPCNSNRLPRTPTCFTCWLRSWWKGAGNIDGH